MESFSVPKEWCETPGLQVLLQNVVDNLQASVSVETWSNYATAMNHLKRCAEYLEIPMNLPLDPIQVFLYIAYLLVVRGVLPTTASGYLSGLRMAHIAGGFPIPTMRSLMVNQILQGAENLNHMRP